MTSILIILITLFGCAETTIGGGVAGNNNNPPTTTTGGGGGGGGNGGGLFPITEEDAANKALKAEDNNLATTRFNNINRSSINRGIFEDNVLNQYLGTEIAYTSSAQENALTAQEANKLVANYNVHINWKQQFDVLMEIALKLLQDRTPNNGTIPTFNGISVTGVGEFSETSNYISWPINKIELANNWTMNDVILKVVKLDEDSFQIEVSERFNVTKNQRATEVKMRRLFYQTFVLENSFIFGSTTDDIIGITRTSEITGITKQDNTPIIANVIQSNNEYGNSTIAIQHSQQTVGLQTHITDMIPKLNTLTVQLLNKLKTINGFNTANTSTTPFISTCDNNIPATFELFSTTNVTFNVQVYKDTITFYNPAAGIYISLICFTPSQARAYVLISPARATKVDINPTPFKAFATKPGLVNSVFNATPTVATDGIDSLGVHLIFDIDIASQIIVQAPQPQ